LRVSGDSGSKLLNVKDGARLSAPRLVHSIATSTSRGGISASMTQAVTGCARRSPTWDGSADRRSLRADGP
jgi:hypothetical protein